MDDSRKSPSTENRSKEKAEDDVEMQEEEFKTDPFALLYNNFNTKTKPGLFSERASIFELISSISTELETNKAKILERQEKVKKL